MATIRSHHQIFHLVDQGAVLKQKHLTLLFIIITTVISLHSVRAVEKAPLINKYHGLSRFDDLKYPEDFQHFNYVNPNAPKGGKIKIAAIGIFDTLNPYMQTGTHISQIPPLNFFSLGFLGLNEPLMMGTGAYSPTGDESKSAYGLIAESVEYPDDNQWITFNLRPEARFHDGKPITADDVEFSFNYLKKKGPIRYQVQLKPVDRVEVLDKYKIRFHFSEYSNTQL